MNHRFRIFILWSFILLFSFCKTKDYTPTKYEGQKISFGTSGGFTGALDAYHLISNGQLFKQEGRKEVFTAMESVPKKEVAALFQQLLDLKLHELKMDDPGNLSKFIEYEAGDIKNKIVWPVEDKNANADYNQFYQKLTNLTKITK